MAGEMIKIGYSLTVRRQFLVLFDGSSNLSTRTTLSSKQP